MKNISRQIVEFLLIVQTACLTQLVIFAESQSKDQAPPTSRIVELFPDEVVAKGEGVEVKRSELDEAFVLVKANLIAGGQPLPEERRKVIEAKILDRLIATKLLLSKATDEDRKKAQESAEKFISDTKSKMVSEEMFNLHLKANGLTFEKFKTRVLEQAICDEVVQREVRSTVNISDEQIEKFYNENPDEFKVIEKRRVAHILFTTKDLSDPVPQLRYKRDLPESQKAEKKRLAESVLARAKKGDDFEKLVKEYSDDITTRDKGGEYIVTRAKDDPRFAMPPEFEAAVFSLSEGEISDIVNTMFGYHIIKLLKIMPAGKKPLAEVKDDIKKYLEQNEVQKKLPEYFAKLKQSAKVQILDNELKEIQEQLLKNPAK